MEHIRTSKAKYHQTAFIALGVIVAIAYLAVGAAYLRQGPAQQALEQQIANLSAMLRNPIPDSKPLEDELTAADMGLAPIGDSEIISTLVELAEKNGIDISEAGGRFSVTVPGHDASDTYHTVSFKGIYAQGAPSSVLAFLRMLDSDEALQPPGVSSPRTIVRVITTATLTDVEVAKVGEEAERAEELRSIQEAVLAMMTANNITSLFYPVSISLGKATRFMGDDPNTIGPDAFEGFPDFTANATEPFPLGKGYTGNETPKNGYLLWQHDQINSDNTTLFTTTNYTPNLMTKYYYTVEQDGKVRQWDRLTLATANEYRDNKPTKMELSVYLDLDIYFKVNK